MELTMERPPASPDDLLDTEQAMELLGLKRNAFFNLRKAGIIVPVNDDPLIKRPARLLFRRGDLEDLRKLNRAQVERLRREAQASAKTAE
jgi:hypothetical protein